MTLFVHRYQYDKTGLDPNNLVENEPHQLGSDPIRIITPKYGYFFKNTVKLYCIDKQEYLDSAKYIFTEYFEEQSIKVGKEIYGAIVIMDDTVVGDINLTYQALGGINSKSSENILAVHFDRLQSLEAVDYGDLTDLPKRVKPTKDHKHPTSIIQDIGLLAKNLSSVGQAYMIGKAPAHNSVIDYIDRIIKELEDATNIKMEEQLPRTLAKFKAQFTKQFFSLDKVVDMPLVKDIEARNSAKAYFKQKDIDINKYFTLSSLVTIKETLFDTLISKLETNIDTNSPKYVLPNKDNLLKTTNGSNISYVGLDSVRSIPDLVDVDLYPSGTHSSKLLTVTRLTNNQENRGGLFSMIDHIGIRQYIGRHADGDKTKPMSWSKALLSGDIDDNQTKLREHITNIGNPHRDTKYSIDLNMVENLRVTDSNTIGNMFSSRTYLTADNLATVMGLIEEQGMWMVEPIDTSGKFLLDNCQVVYSECGKCGCSDRSDFPDVAPPPETTCPAANTLLREFCSTSATTIPSTPGEKLGVNRYGVYTDGNCGEVTKLIEANSLVCGYVAPASGATVELRDSTGRLIGMGYGPNDDKDPNANVRIDDYDGNLMCYIYPKSGAGYDSAFLDVDGSFIGFAVNP